MLSLIMLQGVNFAVPLLALSHVTKVLGVEAYGEIFFFQLIFQFGSVFVGWGFILTATKSISESKSNKNAVGIIFCNVWAAQWVLVLIFSSFFLGWVIFFQGAANWLIVLSGLSIIFGSVALPLWLFQGLEKMQFVSLVQALFKILTLPAYYFLIRAPSDSYLFLLINGASLFLSGLVSICWLYWRLGVELIRPKFANVYFELSKGFSVFCSIFSTSLYVYLIPIILSCLAGPALLGLYSIADKLRMAFVAAITPISQALFPRINSLINEDRARGLSLMRKSGLFLLGIGVMGSIFLFFVSDYVPAAFGGRDFQRTSLLVKIMAPLPIIVSLANIFGVQIMIPLGMHKLYSRIYVAGAFFGILLSFVLIKYYNDVGAAISILLVETFVSLSMMIFVLVNRGEIRRGNV